MEWKLYASILVALFVVDLVPALTADQPRTNNFFRPGTSPHASRPTANAETQTEDFFSPNRQGAALPGMSSQASTPSTSENVQQPVVNTPIRNNAAVPTEEVDRPAAVQEPVENVNPTEQPVANAPLQKTDGAPLGNFGRGQEGPSHQNPNPQQPIVTNPITNNGQIPTGNGGGVREEPVQNPNPIVPDNGAVRDNGMARNLPQPTATNPTQQGAGPTAFGGPNWPAFFQKPHAATSNAGVSNVPMQNPQANGGQGGQGSQSVDSLLEKLNNLNSLLGNNQGGTGLGR